MRKRRISLLLCMAMLFTTLFASMTAQAADKMEIETYRAAGAYSAPEAPAGFVFAGWYEDEAFTQPVDASVTSGEYYAKFIPKAVFNVGYQLTAGTTTESDDTDLRLITTVDTLNFKSVAFDFSGGGKAATLTSTTAYQTLNAYTAKDGVTALTPSTAGVFDATSAYFVASKITDVPKTAFASQLSVTPKWTTLDGTTVTGTARTFTINDAATVKIDNHYLYVDGSNNTRLHFVADDLLFVGGEITTDNFVSGGIKVDGKAVDMSFWYTKPTRCLTIKVDDPLVGLKDNTVVEFGGLFKFAEGLVYVAPKKAIYDAETQKWADVLNITNQYMYADGSNNTRLYFVADDLLYEGGEITTDNFVSGGIKVDGQKVNMSFWYTKPTRCLTIKVDDPLVDLKDGTAVEFGGLFKFAEGYVYVEPKTAVYDAETQKWSNVLSITNHYLYTDGSNNTRLHFVADDLLYTGGEITTDKFLFGGIKVDGQKVDMSFWYTKPTRCLTIKVDNPLVGLKDNTVVEFGGLFEFAEGYVYVEPQTAIYDAETQKWSYFEGLKPDDVKAYTVGSTATRFHLWIDSLLYESQEVTTADFVSGGVKVDGTPVNLSGWWIKNQRLLSIKVDDPVVGLEDGTIVEVGGLWNFDEGQVLIEAKKAQYDADTMTWTELVD